MKKEEKKKCNCEPNCECGCQEGKECTCEDEKCNCGCNDECCCDESCDCGCQDGECSCDDNCDCGCNECNCSNDLEERVKELENELLKSKADFINYRKRLDEEHSRFIKYCNEDLIKELLPILDNFERAINMDDDNLEDEVSKFLSGIKMIYCNFVNTLKNSGVVEIDGANKPFNPIYHEAIMTEKKDGVEKDYVIEVLQKGYILNGKVIRPAMVKVSE